MTEREAVTAVQAALVWRTRPTDVSLSLAGFKSLTTVRRQVTTLIGTSRRDSAPPLGAPFGGSALGSTCQRGAPARLSQFRQGR